VAALGARRRGQVLCAVPGVLLSRSSSSPFPAVRTRDAGTARNLCISGL